ncbi:MAG: CAP domain-containing protein [Candidatus Levyibacteriota bacterium]
MKNFLLHLFFPQESNNRRARLLHHKIIFFAIAFLFAGQFFLTFVKTSFPSVLGTSTNISVQELLLFTNQNRQKENVKPLVLNEELSQAASLKAQDMFNKDYWAHNSPLGTTPWFFIKETGYDYTYAGENLARGFNSSQDIVKAWMESKSHKENMLSANYQDVGFAVASGKLNGEDIVLVVEMFGGKQMAPLASNESSEITLGQIPQTQTLVASAKANPLIDINILSSRISIIILFIFISVLILDMIIIERKKIVRLVGHNLDHIFFLVGILIFIILVGRGLIL